MCRFEEVLGGFEEDFWGRFGVLREFEVEFWVEFRDSKGDLKLNFGAGMGKFGIPERNFGGIERFGIWGRFWGSPE